LLALAAAAAATGSFFSPSARADESTLPPEVGWNYGEIETPRIAAMGGAMRAYSNSLSALFINPANMAATRIYHVGALAQIWPEPKRRATVVARSLDCFEHPPRRRSGGTWTLQDPEGLERRATDLRFALAFPFSEQFLLGVGGRYLWAERPRRSRGQLVSGGLEDGDIIAASPSTPEPRSSRQCDFDRRNN
jgi:hypothetical protein